MKSEIAVQQETRSTQEHESQSTLQSVLDRNIKLQVCSYIKFIAFPRCEMTLCSNVKAAERELKLKTSTLETANSVLAARNSALEVKFVIVQGFGISVRK